MKVLLSIAVFCFGSFALAQSNDQKSLIPAVEPAVWSGDEAAWSPEELQAFWMENGDAALIELVRYGGNSGGGGARGAGFGGFGRSYTTDENWVACSTDMVSELPRAGFRRTPKGRYVNPKYAVRVAGRGLFLCARKIRQ